MRTVFLTVITGGLYLVFRRMFQRKPWDEKLLRMRVLGIKRVRISTCQDERVCRACRKLEGKVFKIRRRMPLPACSQCRCGYSPLIPELG